MKDKTSVPMLDRLGSAISYLTAGWGGVIILFILYVRKKHASHFIRFNAMQSIFIALLFFVLSMGINLLAGFLKYIPLINYLVAQILFIFNRPIFFHWSFIQIFILGLTLYMTVFSLLGRYPRIYKLSKIVDYNAR